MTQPLARACRLSDRVVLVMLELDPRDQAVLDGEGQLPGRWIECPNGQPESTLLLGTALVPAGARGGEPRPLRLAGVEVELLSCSATEFTDQGALAGLDESARARIQDFLAATPTAHGIGLGPELAESLAALRDEVRPALPATGPDHEALAGTLDAITAIDAYGFWLTGSLRRSAAADVRLTAVSPEGTRAEIAAGAVTFDQDSNRGDNQIARYEAYVELEHPSRHRHGWVMEFRSGEAEAFEHAAAAGRVTNPDRVWDRVLAQLAAHPGDELVSARQIAPALARLRAVPSGNGGQPAAAVRSAGPPITSLEVQPAKPVDDAAVTGALVTAPVRQDRSPYAGTYSFSIRGWALPDGGEPVTVEARDPTGGVHRTVAKLARPAVPTRHRDVDVDALSAAGRRTRLGSVRGRRRPLATGYAAAFQPVLVNTLGRSGSSWMVALLSRHPVILALHPFAYEAKLTSYWTGVVRALADPASYMMAVQAQSTHRRWWLGDYRPTPVPVSKPYPEMPQWLGSANVDNLSRIYQSQTDNFYRRLRQIEGRPDARLFVEKAHPGVTPRVAAELYPESREIVLVRDFRDMACSILDYNAKRGFELWGRDRHKREEEWLPYLRAEAQMLLADVRERPERAHVVRYEDLIAAPVETLTAAYAHLGVSSDQAVVEEAIAGAGEMEPHRQESHRTATSFEASVGRWRERLSPESRSRYAEAFDDVLTEFGYEPTTDG
jgi:hypothetical protein